MAAEIILTKAANAGLKYGLTRLYSALVNFPKQNDQRLREAWERDRDDHVVRKLQWLEETLEDVRKTIVDFAAQVEAQSEDPQMHRVWDNFVYESIREATAERREMLAAADAGIVDPRLTIEQKARVERILRQLDPDDVRALYGIDRAVVEDSELYELWGRLPNRDVLVSTGCLRLDPGPLAGAGGVGKPIPQVTPMGYDVLRVMRTYCRKRGAPFEVPGRHPEPDAEACQRAWAMIDRAGLKELMELARRSPTYKAYTLPGRQPFAELSFGGFRGADAAEGLKYVESATATESAFNIQVREHESVAYISVSGPHEILRVPADELEARWTAG